MTKDDTQICGTKDKEFFIQNNSLSRFQKILLVTDGTVTDILRLYTGETIKVKKISQEFTLSDEPEVSICLKETPILKRNILLGTQAKNYIYAESVFVLENLSRAIQYKLLETDEPIGLMWKEEKLETFRKIIGYKNEYCECLAEYFEVPPDTPLLSRTYLIYNNQKIMGMITEKFPITHFKEEQV